MSEEYLLEVEHLTKTYSTRGLSGLLRMQPPVRAEALRGVSFSLRAGEVTALLGPNGAGKTTLINIVCDLTRPDAGRVTIAGLSIPAQGMQARRHVGYASTNDRSFFWRLSGRSNLEFFAALHGYGREQARLRAAEMLARFDLESHADRLFHTYSAGMKKRLGLARTFLHDPAVLLLDEPTSGLDARSTEELLTMVRQEIQRTPKTVLWATHRADEIERLCDRVIVLIGGRVCFHDSAEAFLEISRRHMAFTVDAVVPALAPDRFGSAMGALGLQCGRPGGDGNIELTGTGDEQHLSTVLRGIIDAGGLIRRVERRAEPLHHVFAHLATGDAGERAAVAHPPAADAPLGHSTP